MANIYFGDMLPPGKDRSIPADSGGTRERQRPEGVLVGTASPLKLRVERIDHHLAPEGTACVGTFFRETLISRCAVPEETAEEFLEMELFDRPVSVALNVRPGGPGLEGNLLALVPLSQAEAEEGGEEDEPWKASVPGAGYEEAAREEGDGHLVGIFLGQVVRFEEDREHPDNLVREAADMLAGVVRGHVGKLVDRVLEDLTGPTGLA